jgi:hypothetical protein
MKLGQFSVLIMTDRQGCLLPKSIPVKQEWTFQLQVGLTRRSLKLRWIECYTRLEKVKLKIGAMLTVRFILVCSGLAV